MSNHTHASRLQSPTRSPRRLPATSSGGTIQRQTLAHKTEGDPIAQLEQALRSGFQFDQVSVTAPAQNPPMLRRFLPNQTQKQMEQAFHEDFSNVRIYESTDVEALGASAYARGEEIRFAPGRFDPISRAGQDLIGEELAHVRQQRRGMVASRGGALPINSDPRLEMQAKRDGKRAARGIKADMNMPKPSAIQNGQTASNAPIQMGDDAETKKKLWGKAMLLAIETKLGFSIGKGVADLIALQGKPHMMGKFPRTLGGAVGATGLPLHITAMGMAFWNQQKGIKGPETPADAAFQTAATLGLAGNMIENAEFAATYNHQIHNQLKKFPGLKGAGVGLPLAAFMGNLLGMYFKANHTRWPWEQWGDFGNIKSGNKKH